MIEKMKNISDFSHIRIGEKINEIIDELKLIEERQSIHREFIDVNKDKIKNIYDYVEYFKENAILKPDYDPEDVRFKFVYKPPVCADELAKEGTFEWALIQMKNGKKIRRPKWNKNSYISKENISLNFHSGHLFETDWEIVEC